MIATTTKMQQNISNSVEMQVDSKKTANGIHYEKDFSLTPVTVQQFLNIPYNMTDVQNIYGFPISEVKFLGFISNIIDYPEDDTILFVIKDSTPGEVQCVCYKQTNCYLTSMLNQLLIKDEKEYKNQLFLIYGMLNYRFDIKCNTIHAHHIKLIDNMNHVTYHLLDVVLTNEQRKEYYEKQMGKKETTVIPNDRPETNWNVFKQINLISQTDEQTDLSKLSKVCESMYVHDNETIFVSPLSSPK